MFSDIVGYTAMMGRDEEMAYQLVKRNVRIHQQIIKKHHGKLVKEMGDGVLSAYPSGREAIAAALELQQYYFKSKELSLRIGVHFGEIIEDAHDVFGDAVNIASRLQTLGHPNSVLFSKSIKEDIASDPSFPYVDLGKFHLKNVDENVQIFALANEGLAVPRRGDLSKLLDRRVKRVMIASTVILTLMLVGFGFYHNEVLKGLTDSGEKLIAVLPVEGNLVNSKDSILLAGLADEIINGFSKLEGLKPISFFSTKGYDPKKFTPQEYGRKLGVDFLLLGKTLEINGHAILRIQLLELRKDKILWGETFDLEGEDLIAFQRLLSQRVIASIIPNFEGGTETANLQDRIPASELANRHFLRGKGHYQLFNQIHNDSAIVEFKKALSSDSTFALAYAGLGDAFSQKFREHKGASEYLDSCLWAGEKAVTLNPRLAEGYKTVANYFNYKGQLSTGNTWLRRALEIDKNFAPALGNLGSNYLSTGQLDSALYYQTKAAALNPGLYLPFQLSGWISRLLMDYSNSLAFLKKSLQINEDFRHSIPSMTYEQLALTYLGLEKRDSAAFCVKKTLDLLEDYKDAGGKYDVTKYATVSRTFESAGIIAFFTNDLVNSKKYLEQSVYYNPYKNQDPFSYAPVYLSFLEMKTNPTVGNIFLDEAISLYKREIDSGTEDGEFYFNLACLYAVKGEKSKSLDMLNKAYEMGWRDLIMLRKNIIFENLLKDISVIRFSDKVFGEIDKMKQTKQN